jgi:hypothetical protein
MNAKSVSLLPGLVTLLLLPFAVSAQSNPVRLTTDVLEAATLDVPIDPATRVDPASLPRPIGRRTLEPLGLTAERLVTARAARYSAARLEDAAGSLAVFHASVVKNRDRWVFWSEDLPQEATRAGSEVQLTFDTENGARYLVDFVLDSAEQQFALVVGDTRTTQAPEFGHLALVVTGTGRDVKLRLLPLGDASFKSRRFTLFEVAVTPIL